MNPCTATKTTETLKILCTGNHYNCTLEITFKDIDVIEEIEKKAVEVFMKELGTKVFPRK